MIQKGVKHKYEFQYDFSLDGGAVSNIDMTNVHPVGSTLPEGFLVEMVSVVVETAATSAGTPTVTVGPDVDSDGYLADIWAVLAGAAGSIVRNGEVAGALLWDDTNDHEITYRVAAAANTKNVTIEIGTAAITAGKFKVIVEGYIPTEANRSA